MPIEASSRISLAVLLSSFLVFQSIRKRLKANLFAGHHLYSTPHPYGLVREVVTGFPCIHRALELI
jgi:hypothetical protein